MKKTMMIPILIALAIAPFSSMAGEVEISPADYGKLLSLVQKLDAKRISLKAQNVRPGSAEHEKFLDGASKLIETFNKNNAELSKAALRMGDKELSHYNDYYNALRTIYSSSIFGFATQDAKTMIPKESSFSDQLDELNQMIGESNRLNALSNADCAKVDSTTLVKRVVASTMVQSVSDVMATGVQAK